MVGVCLVDAQELTYFHEGIEGEIMIRPSTKDKSEGTLHELKGTLKQKAGQLTNDPELEAKGLGEKISGKIQKKIGDLERVIEKP